MLAGNLSGIGQVLRFLINPYIRIADIDVLIVLGPRVFHLFVRIAMLTQLAG